MNEVNHLIISNTRDFTTDYICHEMNNRKESYLRLNRDKFNNYKIIFDIDKGSLIIETNKETYIIKETNLRSVYFRAPTFLRENPIKISQEEQLYRSQWAAFVRNLIYFENAVWINNPVSTYRAENKLFQLKTAQKVGLDYPATIATNTLEKLKYERPEYVVKSIDTALLRNENNEAYVYSNVVSNEELMNSNLQIAPVIIQSYINEKTDVRTTVIKDKVYSVKILENNLNIPGDWRLKKDNIQFIPFELPQNIKAKCIELVKRLGLIFGAIDFALSDNVYYFLEINPTGEWAWLLKSAGQNIHIDICNNLIG